MCSHEDQVKTNKLDLGFVLQYMNLFSVRTITSMRKIENTYEV